MQKSSILFSLIGSLAFASGNDQLLKGALIVDDPAKVKTDLIDQVEGVQFDGMSPPDELVSILADYPLTKNGADGLCEAIASYYDANHEYRFSVSVPNQDTSNGVVQVVVAPERLGKVNVKENQFTDSSALTKWVRTSANDTISKKTLAQDLGWLNQNPFRSVKVSYGQGSAPGVTDVDLIVNDKKSWKVSTGVENTGTMPIGTTRVFGAIDVNDFIFTDHTLKLKAAAADHLSEYNSYSVDYLAPLPWRNTLRISGSYSATAPKRENFPQRHRESYQASTRYAIPQWFAENLWVDQITWEAGFDFKGANSNLIVEDDPAPVEKKLAFIGQFAGGVSAERKRDGSKIKAGINFVGSPAQMLPHQSDEDFGNLRAGATARYLYSKMDLSLNQNLPYNWTVSAKGRGQFSLSTLIPSEQFSLGGYSTVRGYQERVVGGDNSICGNLEIATPKIAPVGIWVPKFNDNLTVIGFVDAGYAWFNDDVDGRPAQEGLVGVGSGLRYSVSSYFTSRLDVGFPLAKVRKDDADKPRIHFSAVLSY